MDKILLIDKPYGMTTTYVTNKIKKYFNAEKAGHTGTLDPLATGVVPIFLGKLTKLIPFINENKKKYIVKAIIGLQTETLDISGRVLHVTEVPQLHLETLKKIVKSFIGKYTYVPPSYSAIKINGIPSYKYARQGKEVGLTERISTIYDIHIAKSGEYTFELEVDCSKGTYIRSLVSDIGDKLGVGASVASLRRLSSGSFNVEDSNKFFSLINSQSPIFFNLDDLFSTVEINKSLLDHLKQHSNHKKVNNEFLSNLSKKLGVKSNKDQHKLLTIDEYPVGLINNNFNETGDYIYSDIKLFY